MKSFKEYYDEDINEGRIVALGSIVKIKSLVSKIEHEEDIGKKVDLLANLNYWSSTILISQIHKETYSTRSNKQRRRR